MSYRAVVRHVRYWRGNIHRWSTVYQFVGTPSATIDATACKAVLDHDVDMCYAIEQDNGGAYECQIYDHATGGVPIATYTVFDYNSPSTWVPYTAAAWSPLAVPLEPVAEVALLVEWRAGFSRTGKPVNLRKWYHSVPRSGATANSPDVGPTQLASLRSHAATMTGMLGAYGLTLGSSTGRFAGEASVQQFYGNHQMPKGRRKTAAAKKESGLQGVIFKLVQDEQNRQANSE